MEIEPNADQSMIESDFDKTIESGINISYYHDEENEKDRIGKFE